MRIGAVLRQWIEILAALYLAWCESRRELPLEERAWLLKEMSKSSVILIEALSRAWPESAYVNEIRLEKESLLLTTLSLRAFWGRGAS